MEGIVLSPSRLSLFRECKRCFWMDINKGVKRPNGIFPSLPSGMDLVLKEYFDTFRGNGHLPPEIDGKIRGHLFDDIEKLSVWRNNFKGLEFIHESTGTILRGALDELLVTDDGKHIPIDFKTRGFPLKEDTHEHYQDQMNLYCFLLEKNGMKTADFAYLLFYHPAESQGNGRFMFNVDIVRVETSKEDGERLFLDAIETLQGNEPECSETCEWCNWNR